MPSVEPCEKPMNVAPSPLPDASHDEDAKYSMRKFRFGSLVSVPWMRTLPLAIRSALARAGGLWPSFAKLTSEIPLPPFPSIEFCVIVSLVPVSIRTPSCALLWTELSGPMRFAVPLDSMAASFFVFVTVFVATTARLLSAAIPLRVELRTTLVLTMLPVAGPPEPPSEKHGVLRIEMPWLKTPKSGTSDAFDPIVFALTVLLPEPQMSMPWYSEAIVLFEITFEPVSCTSTPLPEFGNEVVWSAVSPSRLCSTWFDVPFVATSKSPRKTSLKLFAMTLPSAGVAPPMTLFDALRTHTPGSPTFASAV